ncbi:hypothetical protein SAY87_011812 [Trapa incisa]|uniref:Protein SGT1 homolog n=2 Tax=Trapa TaxID=22665 RepID=A0AAN7MIU4_TRANT|nr:hypothetical protein SAY87_011812 [Trapa incisa]KAK4796313.1 hypothetical protein SAY86_028639 [Trapa natans]
MASDLEANAKTAFIDDHFELAVDLYTQALSLDPNNAELFADRAQANLKLRNYTEAVADANRAIQLDPNMAKAYLRKGNACFELEEYQTAKAALELGATLAPGDSRFPNLIKTCMAKMAEESSDIADHPMEKAPTNTLPPVIQPGNGTPPQEARVMAMGPRYRHEFYQKPEEVVVTIFAKGIPAKYVTVDFGEQILSVSIDLSGEEPYHFQPRLFGKIIPNKCRYTVLSTKIEIRLVKAEPIHWASLEFRKENTVARIVNISSDSSTQRPSYPSSKPKRVDWDKLEALVKKEEKEEKLDGDAALNKFFREIYQDADEDARRAMSKSFVESNGTVLSTNWKEVGLKKVEGNPPDGMEVKKWEY